MMVQHPPRQPEAPRPKLVANEDFSTSSDDEFWAEIGRQADQLQLKRKPEVEPGEGNRPHPKRLRRLGLSLGSSPLDSSCSHYRVGVDVRKAFSDSDSSDEELELEIPRTAADNRPAILLGSAGARPATWWERLNTETLAIVRDRLGHDFHFGVDDPVRVWQNIPPRHYWGFPSCLIQVDAHTLVSKRRFEAIVKTRIKTDIEPGYIDFLIGGHNVIMRSSGGYWSPEFMKEKDRDLLKIWMDEEGLDGPFNARPSHFKLPEIIAQADEDTFVSGEKLNMKLNSAGVRIGQLMYEEQVFLLNHNGSGKPTGNFSQLSIYAKGYRKLNNTQRDLLKLPANVQSKPYRDTSDAPYRDFTDDLYPHVGEHLYPKGPEDFDKQFISGFRDLKKADEGWADEVAMMQGADMRRDLLKRTPNAASFSRD